MPTILGRFVASTDITNPGFDGRVQRFDVQLIDAAYLNMPRQSSETRTVQVCVEIADSRSSTWDLSGKDLEKVLFQFAKEALTRAASAGNIPSELRVAINTITHPGACPFSVSLIEDPTGAVVELVCERRIGFI